MARTSPARASMRSLGFDLEVDSVREIIEPAFGEMEPDPDWKYLDADHHAHFMMAGDYPTLELLYRGCDYPEHAEDDCPGASYYVCRLCRVEITPGRRPARSVAGETTVTCRLTIWEDRLKTVWTFNGRELPALEEVIRDAVKKHLTDAGVPMDQEFS